MADPPAKKPRTERPRTVIVGGGIGGCAAAIALTKAGADVSIYEAAEVLMEIGAGINVQSVAIGILDSLGITEDMLADPVTGDAIRTSKVQYYTMDNVQIAEERVGRNKGTKFPQISTHRAKFHNVLVAKAREAIGEDNVHLNHSFVGMDRHEDGTITAHFAKNRHKSEERQSVTCDFLIGADGLKSAVRGVLLGDSLCPRYTGITIWRGLCMLDAPIGDGCSVVTCGDSEKMFMVYPISEGTRKDGKAHVYWGFLAKRPEPAGVESWRGTAKLEDIRDELATMDGNVWGGRTPLQMAENTENILGWALFDRDPLSSFDFGTVTLLGDAAHPLLPYGSQGASQAILDAEALGIAYKEVMAAGHGVNDVIKKYSNYRCEVSGKVILANREMGSTKVLKMADEKFAGMSKEEKQKWIEQNGCGCFNGAIEAYRASVPKSISLASG